MATISLSTLLARARVLATQTGGDATQSVVIDNLAGLRAALNHCILEIYRRKAKDPRFLRDITTRSTVTITSGTGTVPTTTLKEFLHQADFTDDNNSFVTYYDYAVDFNSSTNYAQLGYVYVLGSDFKYMAPNRNLSYSGNLFVTTPTAPAVATSMTFQSEQTIDDIILLLSQAIIGKASFEVVNV